MTSAKPRIVTPKRTIALPTLTIEVVASAKSTATGTAEEEVTSADAKPIANNILEKNFFIIKPFKRI